VPLPYTGSCAKRGEAVEFVTSGLVIRLYGRFSSDKQNERSIDDQVALCPCAGRARGLFGH
jgi:hypothetical protein